MQEMDPLVSVIVAAYNVEKYISKCLESIIRQSYSNLEIIVVNDGSTDKTSTIIENYARQDSRIILINQKNQGRSGARNTGLLHAKGEWTAFVDGDDEIKENTYALASKHFSKDIDLVWFEIEIIYQAHEEMMESDGQYYSLPYTGEAFVNDQTFLERDLSVCNKLFRSSIIREYEIDFPPGCNYEDACFFWKYLSVIKKIYFLKEKLYIYYRRPTSIMSSTFERQEDNTAVDHIRILDFIFDFWKKWGKLQSNVNLFKQLCVNYFWFSWNWSPNFKKAKVIWEMTKRLRSWNLDVEDVPLLHSIKNGLYEVEFEHPTQIKKSSCLIKYWKYRLLQYIVWGKTRRRYIRKKRMYRELLKQQS